MVYSRDRFCCVNEMLENSKTRGEDYGNGISGLFAWAQCSTCGFLILCPWVLGAQHMCFSCSCVFGMEAYVLDLIRILHSGIGGGEQSPIFAVQALYIRLPQHSLHTGTII